MRIWVNKQKIGGGTDRRWGSISGVSVGHGKITTDVTRANHYEDVLAYWDASGWALPDAAPSAAFNTMITSIGGTLLNKAEFFNFFSTHNQDCSLTNWATAGVAFNPTAENNPTWTQYGGYAGDAVAVRYLRGNFIPSVHGTKIGQDNMCVLVGVGNTVDNEYVLGASNSVIFSQTFLAPIAGGGLYRTAINTGNTSNNVANAIGTAHFGISRGFAANYDRYINLAKSNVILASANLTNLEMYFCCYNRDGVPTQISASPLRYVWLSSYLTEAEMGTVVNAIETCLDSLGTGLIP